MAAGMRAAGITPFFKTMPFEDGRKSMEAGRPIFTDIPVVEIRFAGSKDITVQPVHQFSHWEVDEETGVQREVTYAERWPKQYRQFLEREAQTKSGTPLDYVPFLTPSKRAELRALNIYTIEALAELDGQPLKNLGIGGRELKNKAVDYLASTSHNGIIIKQQAQIEALMNQIKLLQDDRQQQNLIAAPVGPNEPLGPERIPTPPEKEDEPEEEGEEDGNGDDERQVAPGLGTPPELIGMDKAALRTFIVEKTGKRPIGNPSMKNLLRIATEINR